MQLHNVRDNIVKGLKAEALSTDYRSGSQVEAIEVRLNETKLERREHEMEIMNVIGFHFSWLVYFRILLSLNFDLPMHENNNLKPMYIGICMGVNQTKMLVSTFSIIVITQWNFTCILKHFRPSGIGGSILRNVLQHIRWKNILAKISGHIIDTHI